MFECRYKADDFVIKEFVRKVLAQKIIGQGLFMMVVAILLTALSTRSSHRIVGYICVALAFASVAAFFYAPTRVMKKFKSSDKAFFNGKAEETVVTFDENKITVTEDPSYMTFSYDQVERISVFKVICVLMTSKSNGIVLKKDSFGEHSFEEFLTFINEKCVNKNKAAERERQEALERKKNKHKKNAKPEEVKSQEAAKEAPEEKIEEVKAEIAGIDESEVADVVDAEIIEEEKN